MPPTTRPTGSQSPPSSKPLYTNSQLVNTRRGPAPRVVREKVASLIDLSLSYELDEYEPFRDKKESGSSLEIRTLLAGYFGATADEIALTRNAMEGIATVLNGFDLKAGDEVLATNLCYDSNIAILKQRALREGITVKRIDLPLEPTTEGKVMAIFETAITEKTKLISIPHIYANTGLILPVQAVSQLAHQRGIFTLVDGAHSAGHIDFHLDDLGCDIYATCLHKWMYGPRGTGFLYIRKQHIEKVWPLFAPWSDKPTTSIEKFEEVGTVFKGLSAAIPESIKWNLDIGQKEKAARLRYLRDRWATRLYENKRIRLLTDIDAEPGTAFGAFVVDHGRKSEWLASLLLADFDINVKVFELDKSSYRGIHVSPSLANTIEEVDRFVDATLFILAHDAEHMGDKT